MKSLPSVFAVLELLLMMSVGCSVKEDRSGCPCRLILDLGELDSEVFPSVCVNVTTADGFLSCTEVEREQYPAGLVLDVPYETFILNVNNIAPDSAGGYDALSGLVIPYGSNCPEYYNHHSIVTPTGDCIRETVHLHKEWCNLSITVLFESGPAGYALAVEGSSCGYQPSGEIVDGGFHAEARPDDNGLCIFRLPRQKDDSLVLLVNDGSSVLREFAIGAYIKESGYDWSRADLEDIQMTVDFARTDILFRVGDWEKVFSYDVEL